MDHGLSEPTQRGPLADLLNEVGQLTLGNRMWPEEIIEAQAFLDRVRTFELPRMGVVKQVGARLVLRRVERKMKASRTFIVDRFCGPEERKGGMPHSTQPLYAGQAWMACKDWIQQTKGQAGLDQFALAMWKDVMNEAMRYQGGIEYLGDILDAIKGERGQLSERLPGLIPGWAKLSLDSHNDHPVREAVLDFLIAHGADVEGQNAEGDTALVVAGDKAGSGILSTKTVALQLMDLLLEREAQWQDKQDELSKAARDYITEHPWGRKKRLEEIANVSLLSSGNTRKM